MLVICLKPPVSCSLTQNKNLVSTMTKQVLHDLDSTHLSTLFYHDFPPGSLCASTFASPSFLTHADGVPASGSLHFPGKLSPRFPLTPFLSPDTCTESFWIPHHGLSSHVALFFFIEVFHLIYYRYLLVIILLLLKSISKRMPIFFIAVSPGPITVLCL